MNNRDARFLALYRTHRHEDQRNFYEERRAGCDAAHEQGVDLSAWLMVGSTAVAALAVGNVGGLHEVWAVLAVALPALSSALAAYDKLYMFDQQAKLYHDAAVALQRARADAPDLRAPLAEAEYRQVLGTYVHEVEGVFRREQGQWGQLISELQPVAPEASPAQKQD